MNSLEDFTNNFKNTPKKSINSFINLATEIVYKKSDIITEVGEISKNFYIIKSGIVRSFYSDEKGKQHIRTLFTSGRTTGALGSLISGKPSKLTYDCLTDCAVYQINYKECRALIKSDPTIAILYTKVLEQIFLMMESRIYDLSILNATERYLKLKEEIPNIENIIPQYHIASYLNVSAVQLSRIRKEILK
jgi:CRP-like cAMP-binding protein